MIPKAKQSKYAAGKGGKDRFTVLGDENLTALRQYWKLYRPKDLLFPSLIDGQPIAKRNIQYVFKHAKEKADITKPATVHTLRHSFATHLLENNTASGRIARRYSRTAYLGTEGFFFV